MDNPTDLKAIENLLRYWGIKKIAFFQRQF